LFLVEINLNTDVQDYSVSWKLLVISLDLKVNMAQTCVYILKQITEYYNQRSNPVYICYFDASKAFYRINHWYLFKKLIKRNNDVSLIRLLIFWYCQQTICVRWGRESVCNSYQ
jgi:hypothetical protein